MDLDIFLIDIVIIRTNSVFSDPRLVKIIRSLKKKYSIVILGWNREGMELPEKDLAEYSKRENKSNDAVVTIFKLKAPFGKTSLTSYFPLIVYFPIFWTWVFVKLIKHRPTVVHACDVDTVLPCLLYKLLFRKKMVFEVFDRYAMTYFPIKFKLLYSAVNLFEEFFSYKADVLITVTEKLLETFRKRPKTSIIIMNCSEDHMIVRSRLEENSFKLFFPGHIRPGRGLEILPRIVNNLKDTQLIITGRVENKKLLNNITGIPNIKYLGYLDYDKLIHIEAHSDVIVALYDLKAATQNEYVMGNKLFEAMMFGIPIISNVAQELIKEVDCGIVVEYDNADQIREAIVMLKDNPSLTKKLGNNGRKAFLEKYNWNRMEKKLYEIYDNLLHN